MLIFWQSVPPRGLMASSNNSSWWGRTDGEDDKAGGDEATMFLHVVATAMSPCRIQSAGASRILVTSKIKDEDVVGGDLWAQPQEGRNNNACIVDGAQAREEEGQGGAEAGELDDRDRETKRGVRAGELEDESKEGVGASEGEECGG